MKRILLATALMAAISGQALATDYVCLRDGSTRHTLLHVDPAAKNVTFNGIEMQKPVITKDHVVFAFFVEDHRFVGDFDPKTKKIDTTVLMDEDDARVIGKFSSTCKVAR